MLRCSESPSLTMTISPFASGRRSPRDTVIRDSVDASIGPSTASTFSRSIKLFSSRPIIRQPLNNHETKPPNAGLVRNKCNLPAKARQSGVAIRRGAGLAAPGTLHRNRTQTAEPIDYCRWGAWSIMTMYRGSWPAPSMAGQIPARAITSRPGRKYTTLAL